MSAIAGIIQFDAGPIDPAELRILAEASAMRGPDGIGRWTDPGIGLLHLAFHQTPESVHERQPLLAGEGRWALVADVRLDNRDELITELKLQAGATPITDPEILLRAFIRWGAACVEHLLGDFVFAIWDRRERSLFLARDPLGGHSLSLHHRTDGLVFASETSAILELPGVPGEIDPETLARSLSEILPAGDSTYFRAVRYLPPGVCLVKSPAGERQWRYWEPDPGHRIEYKNDAEYTEHFLCLLNQAVASRLRSIGPVGLSLSGGKDSTLLAACAQRLLPEVNPQNPRLITFSNVFDQHPSCDERPYIEPVIARHDLDAVLVPSDEFWSFRDLGRPVVARDVYWTNVYAQLPRSVAKAARAKGCRVLLDGQYGDALFDGPSYYAADLIHRGQWRALGPILRQEDTPADLWRALWAHGFRLLAPNALRTLYRRLKPFRVSGLLADPGPIAALGRRAAAEAHARCPSLPGSRRPRCQSLLSPIWPQGKAAVRGLLYARHGLENSSPYFDRRLVEFILAIPQEQIARPGERRRLQRRAMQSLLPPKVWQREEKTNFFALMRAGMAEERERIETLLQNPRIIRQGWIDGPWLATRLQSPNPDDQTLFQLSLCANLELWLAAVEDAQANGGWMTSWQWRG